MEKLSKKAFKPLDQEEKELMESIEHDEWQSVNNFDQEKEEAIQAARNTLKKRKTNQSSPYSKGLPSNSNQSY